MKKRYEVLKDFRYGDLIPLSKGSLVTIAPNAAEVYIDQKFLKLFQSESLTKKEKSAIIREEGAE
jgi:hypothetical protein